MTIILIYEKEIFKMSKTKKVLIFLIVLFSLAIIGLVIGLVSVSRNAKTMRVQLENNYKRSYYNFVDSVNDIEVDITKLVATNSSETQKKLLSQIYEKCTTAAYNLNEMPISASKTNVITSYINTLGGYAFSLIEKVSGGEILDAEDLSTISTFHSISKNANYTISNYLNGLDFDYNILENIDFSNEFNQSNFDAGFVNIDIEEEIPTLIFDGPFSDSVINREIKGLPIEEISQQEAESKVESLCDYYKDFSVDYIGETLGKFATYNFNLKKDSGESEMFVQISKRGGLLLNITGYGSFGEKRFSEEECMDFALDAVNQFGFEDLCVVWCAENKNIVYVNLAPIVNGVIYYPDLIKIKIDNSTGVIVGLEAQNYAYNHIDRESFDYSIDISQAQNLLNSALEVKERNFCIIANDYNGESFAYEFVCTWKDYIYYIYLDVDSGEELKIMRVVDTKYGELVV